MMRDLPSAGDESALGSHLWRVLEAGFARPHPSALTLIAELESVPSGGMTSNLKEGLSFGAEDPYDGAASHLR
jgi:hypothetical protein